MQKQRTGSIRFAVMIELIFLGHHFQSAKNGLHLAPPSISILRPTSDWGLLTISAL